MRTTALSNWHIVSRVGAGVLGSYAFAWGFVALLGAGMLLAGQHFHEAVELSWMLGFLVYLGAFCYAFVSASVSRAWLVLAGGGAAMTLAGWWLSRTLH